MAGGLSAGPAECEVGACRDVLKAKSQPLAVYSSIVVHHTLLQKKKQRLKFMTAVSLQSESRVAELHLVV